MALVGALMTQILGGSIVALVGVALALMTKRQRWTRNPCRSVSQPSAEDPQEKGDAGRCSGAAAGEVGRGYQ